MSKTTKEALKTPEKTPAEIATELEKKATTLDEEGKQAEATRKRELAKKVREVESSTVTGTTELKLEALQAKLPPLEKADLKEARTITTAEIATGAAGLTLAAVAINKQIDDSGLGHLGIKDSIKEWIAGAINDEPGEDDGPFDTFIHKLKMIFLLPFAKVFGVDLTKKKGEKDGEGGEKKERINLDKKEAEKKESKEIVNAVGFTAGYKGFTRIYKNSIPGKKTEIEASKLDNFFNYSEFQKLTFQQAEDLYKKYGNISDKKGLLKDVKLENAVDANALYLCLGLIVASDGRKFLEKKYPDGMASKTIGEIFEGVKDQFNIAANLEAIEINNLQDVSGFMGEIGKKMDLAFDDDGKIKTPYLQEKVQKLGLNKKDLLIYIVLQSPDKPIDDLSKKESIDGLYLEAESKDVLSKIVTFGEKMEQSIAQSFSFGNQQIYAEYLKTHPLTLLDTFKLYAVLGGKTDQGMMSPPEQLYVYQKLWHILSGDQALRGKYFDRPISEALWNSKSNIQIPDEVKNVFSNLMTKAYEKFKEKATGAAKELWEYLDTTTIVAVTAALGAYFIWGKKIGWVFTGVTLATLTFTIASILRNSAGSDGNITLSSGKYSPEKAAEILIKDAE